MSEIRPGKRGWQGLADRFWAKVDKRGPDECWPWLASTDSTGYGRISVNFKQIRASRVAMTLASGALPPGAHVLHRCDNPLCCNPAHLYLGTHQDNMADRHAKGIIYFSPLTTARELSTFAVAKGQELEMEYIIETTDEEGRWYILGTERNCAAVSAVSQAKRMQAYNDRPLRVRSHPQGKVIAELTP